MSSSSLSSPAHPWAGRVAFVSGGASGIGLGLAQSLAARGVRIALSDVRRDALEQACASLRREGADVLPVVLDVADRTAMYAAAETVEQHFGKVHYVFNNAGVGELGTPMDEEPDDVFDWVIDVNLRGVFNAFKAFVPKVRSHREGGHIVNTSSMAGFVTEPGWHQGLYSATKRGLLALTMDLRVALQDTGIGVSVLCPGLVKTELNTSTVALRPGPAIKAPELPPLLAASAMPPRVAGEIVMQGIERGDFYILTDPQLWPRIAQDHDELRQAFETAAQWVPAAAAAARAALEGSFK